MSRPSQKTESRTRAQRERILAAAQTCFVRSGFHAASMAMIAETAGMSPGLIYRYFDSKSAIILAIIEQQLAQSRADIAALEPDADLVPVLTQLFTRWQRDDCELMSPALMLEMTAEATRDPQIAQALADADRVTGEDLHSWLRKAARRDGHPASAREIEARSFLLRCVLGGLAIRAIREPELDRGMLAESLELVLPQLLR